MRIYKCDLCQREVHEIITIQSWLRVKVYSDYEIKEVCHNCEKQLEKMQAGIKKCADEYVKLTWRECIKNLFKIKTGLGS